MPVRSERVLIVDDDRILLRSLTRLLERRGYQVTGAPNGAEGLKRASETHFNLALVDYHLPDTTGPHVIRAIKATSPSTAVIAVTGQGDAAIAFEMLREGASDYFQKPIEDFKRFFHVIRRTLEVAAKTEAIDTLRERVRHLSQLPGELSDLIGNSPAMENLRASIARVGRLRTPVLVVGESGVGKERVSRALHAASPASAGPFVAINCAGFQKDLLESELFGYEAGAFTGAARRKLGLCEVAADGSLFLDEVGEIPIEMQAKLLRMLNELEFRRVGGTRSVDMTARIISATNVELRQAIEQRRFREDLYFRLNVFELRVPPLRERREDIPLLAYYFLQKYNTEYGTTIRGLGPAAMAQLQDYDWRRNNVRELERVIQRAVILCERGDELTLAHISVGSGEEEARRSGGVDTDLLALSYKEAKEQVLRDFSRGYLRHHLDASDGNITRAAEGTGMLRPNFSKLMKKYEVTTD